MKLKDQEKPPSRTAVNNKKKEIILQFLYRIFWKITLFVAIGALAAMLTQSVTGI